ncbi:50S ribosomal protein L4 [Candidatus Woesearchaeota archaeon]|jgi:large subunit ribosomal protein L4e|nr:50S ribosomal protein L4 [Candidatus Woesearchaeota archaeon]
MDLAIYNLTKTETNRKKVPEQFSELIRPDIIKKAVFAIRSHKRQPYGASPEAGKRHSTNISRRRNNYKTSYGHGISRVPRKILSHRGERFNWVGAFAPGTVGGRRAHPPKADKIWDEKINKKERRKAIRSALAATLVPQLVEERGHKIPKEYPFFIENKFESLDKTSDVKKTLEKLGFEDELKRSSVKKIRAGKGKMRGRKYKKRKGPLLVVSEDCKLLKSASNIPGVDVVVINKVNAELLAPGTQAGRLTLFTEAAIDKIEKENLFM